MISEPELGSSQRTLDGLRRPSYARRWPAMLGNRTSDQWIAQYATSHQHPVNRFCHTIGIPLIVLSLPLFVVAMLVDGFWPAPLALFVVGWILQFVGHAFEGKPPEFFHDWRFLLVGLRWWVAKVRGRA
jgi:uncharacterized membrane protein YGL010W